MQYLSHLTRRQIFFVPSDLFFCEDGRPFCNTKRNVWVQRVIWSKKNYNDKCIRTEADAHRSLALYAALWLDPSVFSDY